MASQVDIDIASLKTYLADPSLCPPFVCRAWRTSPAACAGRAWGGRRHTSRLWRGRWWATTAPRSASRSCSSTGPSSDAPPLTAPAAQPHLASPDHRWMPPLSYYYYVLSLVAFPLHLCASATTARDNEMFAAVPVMN